MRRLLDLLPFRGPKRYGGYDLLEEVARGGMSRIWKARHPSTGRIYALKVLTPESAETQDRFRRLLDDEEGAIALRLDHANVVRTYEYGTGRKGDYYIVMQYVDGPNLQAMINVKSPIVRERRFDLLMQMAAGLSYIHEQGLVHRDFCPKNVLLGDDGLVKIIDFGLTIPAVTGGRGIVTRAGTASYMAPEQVRNQQVDARTDIYAFGVSAFEVLTFQSPFPRRADRTRRMLTHLNVRPVALCSLDPGLPDALGRAVEKCVEKDRDLRYKSMADVMEELKAAIAVTER